MKTIDEEIRAVLSAEEMNELERLTGEQGVFDMIGDSFRTKMRYWIVLLWVYSAAAFGGAVWSGFRFYQATDPKQMAIWGGLCIMLMLAIVLIKIWYWMEINKNTLVRELKRVELQIAYLAKAVAPRN